MRHPRFSFSTKIISDIDYSDIHEVTYSLEQPSKVCAVVIPFYK